MKILFKRYKEEYDQIELDMAEIDYHFGGDILAAVKSEDRASRLDGMEYELLDCRPNERERNRNMVDKGFEIIGAYRNENDYGLYKCEEEERVEF